MGNRTLGQTPHLKFYELAQPSGKRTRVWEVLAGVHSLGTIRWHAPWRRYCFFPNELTLYDALCLREIADFVGEKTLTRKAERRLERIGL